MATITVTRNKEFAYRHRRFVILIDDEKAEKVAAGETQRLSVAAGKHTLVVQFGALSRSRQLLFHIEEQQQKHFLTGAMKYGKTPDPAFMMAGLAALLLSLPLYFILPESVYAIIVLCLFLAGLLYVLIKGGNEVLFLEENKDET